MVMRRYITYMLGLMLSIATIGCVKTDDAPIEQQGVVKLQLASSIVATRAETPGNGVGEGENDKNHNEDLIKTAQVFLFTENSAEAKVAYSSELITVTNNQLTLPLDNSQLDALFPNNTGYAYVVANAQKIAATVGTTTLANLKATEIGSTFATKTIQDSFVMDSERVALKRDGNNVATSDSKPIYLTRAAAKIELTVNVKNSIVVGGQTWTPDTGNMTLQFFNGAATSVVDDGSDENAEDAQTATSYFNLSGDKARKFQTAESTDKTKYICTVVDSVTEGEGENATTTTISPAPYYTYSTNWAGASDKEPYFLLTIPWQVTKTNGNFYQNYTYQIPINSSALSLVRNSYYKLTLDVGVLGGQIEPVLVEPSYVVIDWGTNQVNVELSRPKYLVVDENEVVMNNLTSYGVGYQSSDEVTAYITGFKCSFYENVNGNATKREYNNTYNVSQKLTSINDVAPSLTNSTFTVKVDKNNGKIVLEHDLDNIMPDKVYHYFPYEITVQVTNPALPGNPEIIVFKQYPALYVEYETMNSCTAFVNGNNSRSSGWWWIAGTASNSHNIYKVTVSAFDSSTASYIIADPREPANNDNFVFRENINANSNVRTTATDASGDNTLTGYRGTITGPASENLVAPAFLVSSSYITNGGNGVNTYNYNTNGKYRCAGYQENGYPAGRWRLPTPAEIQVIARMCTEKKLENVFYANGSTYLSSNGAYRVYETNGGTVSYEGETSATLRCVYDIWYWKDKAKNNSQFIWGADGDVAEKKAKGTYDTYLTPVQQ